MKHVDVPMLRCKVCGHEVYEGTCPEHGDLEESMCDISIQHRLELDIDEFICSKCGGKGHIPQMVDVDYYGMGDPPRWSGFMIKCNKCDGAGKLSILPIKLEGEGPDGKIWVTAEGSYLLDFLGRHIGSDCDRRVRGTWAHED